MISVRDPSVFRVGRGFAVRDPSVQRVVLVLLAAGLPSHIYFEIINSAPTSVEIQPSMTDALVLPILYSAVIEPGFTGAIFGSGATIAGVDVEYTDVVFEAHTVRADVEGYTVAQSEPSTRAAEMEDGTQADVEPESTDVETQD
jgi:hypothetical protein